MVNNYNHKKAITLVELLISVSITSVIMVLLFSVIGKKATITASYQRGTYYCWKDWSDILYQKTPTGSIQRVTNCMIKIPKNAKNIKVYVIGGGSAGYAFNTDKVRKKLSEQLNTEKIDSDCIDTSKIYNGYTHIQKGEGGVTEALQLDEESKNDTKLKIKSIYKKYFDDEFSNFLIKEGKCYVPFYDSGIQKTVSVPKMAAYYSPGNSLKKKCTSNSIYDCYNNGYFLDINGNILEPNFNNKPNDDTKELKTLSNHLILPGEYYGIPNPGNIKEGTAVAGEEYHIASSSVGSGGKIGVKVRGNQGAGYDTSFNGITAEGGQTVNQETGIDYTFDNKIKTLDDIKNSRVEIDIRRPADIYAKFNDEILAIPGIEIKSDVKIDINFDPKTQDETIEKGFGLFGISGVNPFDKYEFCIFKSFKYYGSNIGCSSIQNFPLGGSRGFTNGMGGAIIIKWD